MGFAKSVGRLRLPTLSLTEKEQVGHCLNRSCVSRTSVVLKDPNAEDLSNQDHVHPRFFRSDWNLKLR